MKYAIDSSVLFSIFKGEADSSKWLDLLVSCASEGALCICAIVAAEVGAYFGSSREFNVVLEKLQIQYDDISLAAAFHAGVIFKKYRSEGGKREFLIPDFLVAAHAFQQADGFLAIDRGYIRRYFPQLKLIKMK